MSEPWGPLVRGAEQALLEGRFGECERLAAEAARLAPSAPAPALLAVVACREQGRAAEAEVRARGFLAEHPGSAEGAALLAAVLADLGRDSEAGRQLDALDTRAPAPVVAALAAEAAAALDSSHHAEALYRRLADHAGTFAGCHGSVSRHLGLLGHVLDRWDEAEVHFQDALRANQAAGAPVLVAHTRRHYSALLRARGEDGDWEQAIDLLAQAASIYRRLHIERLADEAELVLQRSQDLATADERPEGANRFCRTDGGWDLAYGGQRAVVDDLPGLRHIAALLVADGRPVLAVDLVVEGHLDAELGDRVVAEFRARLAELESDVGAAADPLAAALARAERDFLHAELAVLAEGGPPAAEAADRARRLVALRIRTCLDRLDDAVPALARHLRRSIRTGTFCLYQPERPERWKMAR